MLRWALYNWVGTHWRWEHPIGLSTDDATHDVKPPISLSWVGNSQSVFRVTLDPQLGYPKTRTLDYNSFHEGERVRPLGSTAGDNMAQKEFTMQVRMVSDDKNVFASGKEIMKQACRDVHAQLTILGGSNDMKPDIKLFSDDFIEGKEELVQNAGDLKVDEDENDKVL